jgi:hypothetical protein
MTISVLLARNGLNMKFSEILTSDLTAYPLKGILESLIPEIVELNDADRRIVKLIMNRLQKLIEDRNNIIHSTWFVGWSSPEDTDFSEVFGLKTTKGKSGRIAKHFNYKSEDFDKLSIECDDLAKLINTLSVVVFAKDEISKNFQITETGEVTIVRKSSDEN